MAARISTRPVHFSKEGRSAGEVPLEQLVAAAVVIDVVAQAGRDAAYRVTRADVEAFEALHGRIAPGTIVLVRTGWSRFWGDRKRYLGDDTPGDASKLRFPGFGAEAVRLLVEDRRVALLGIDTASIDYGPSTDFAAHRIGAAANVPNLENLAALDQLPATGATVIALPMKIARGSGGPVRVIALVPRLAAAASGLLRDRPACRKTSQFGRLCVAISSARGNRHRSSRSSSSMRSAQSMSTRRWSISHSGVSATIQSPSLMCSSSRPAA